MPVTDPELDIVEIRDLAWRLHKEVNNPKTSSSLSALLDDIAASHALKGAVLKLMTGEVPGRHWTALKDSAQGQALIQQLAEIAGQRSPGTSGPG
ncbi:hypothetical protein [Labrys sp. 22185]|uniref:hypothetical protein n=1 Tax=Labrys sp. 22185 TaxID=3453888 RepID=UPI003F8429D2